MSTVTVFSTPKPFTDPHIDIIQKNAIRSWKALGPSVDVVLIGEEKGMAEVALDLEVHYQPEVDRNELGTPLIPSIFYQARQAGGNDILLYTNADIILLPDIIDIINEIHQLREDFLLVGRRWDLNIAEEMDFKLGWVDELRLRIAHEGKLRSPAAMDFFAFPRHLFHNIPPLAVGRAGWDNWMIYHANQQPWPVIDVTSSVKVVHQNHDYSHLPGGKPHYDLEESYQNVELSGGMKTLYDILDVDWVYQNGKIRRKGINLPRLLRKLERAIIPEYQEGWRWSLTRKLRQWRRKLSKIKD
jgi:hypothetical protein